MNGIKIVVMDVDGVLTDGRIVLDDKGVEYKFFDVKDGHIIHIALEAGIKIAWISGRYSETTDRRAKQLKIEDLYQNEHKKIEALKKIKNKYSLEYNNIAYIGDDLIDIPPMILSGFSACPNDAVSDVKKVADYVSEFNGGRGAVRDIMELILKRLNLWDGILEKYLLIDKYVDI